MNKPRVIVCDSGVAPRYRDCVQCVDVGCGWQDGHGHGSQIVGLRDCFGVELDLISIKVLDQKNMCDVSTLITALEVINELEADIVCLALAIDINEISDELRAVFHNIRRTGKILISALQNRKDSSYPAALNDVIGVCMTQESLSSFYDKSKAIQCKLPIEPIILESLDGRYQVFRGNSLACALFTYHVACCMVNSSDKCSFSEMETILSTQSVNDLLFHEWFCDPELQNDINTCLEVTEKLEQCLTSVHHSILGSQKNFETFLSSVINKGLCINTKSFLRMKHIENIDLLAAYLIQQRELL